MLNFVFFEMVCLVWKTRSRFVQFFKKVNGCDYSQLFSTLLWNYTNRRDIGISNNPCFWQKSGIPKMVKSREISDIQKVFELTPVFVEIFLFFPSENRIETPLVAIKHKNKKSFVSSSFEDLRTSPGGRRPVPWGELRPCCHGATLGLIILIPGSLCLVPAWP